MRTRRSQRQTKTTPDKEGEGEKRGPQSLGAEISVTKSIGSREPPSPVCLVSRSSLYSHCSPAILVLVLVLFHRSPPLLLLFSACFFAPVVQVLAPSPVGVPRSHKLTHEIPTREVAPSEDLEEQGKEGEDRGEERRGEEAGAG
eukprot:750119-Hanusia_phi.AAC.1